MLNQKVVMFAEYVDKTFAHITIYPALDGIINGWHSSFYFKKNIEEPFRIGIEMLPMGYKHIIPHSLVTMIHRFFKSWNILRATFFDNLAKHFPIFSNMVISVLLSIANTPVTRYWEYDVVFL